MTQKIKFDIRKGDQSIEFGGSTTEITEGCNVDLEHNGVRISAKIISVDGETWVGQVIGVGDDIGDLEVGSKVYFQDEHILTCAA